MFDVWPHRNCFIVLIVVGVQWPVCCVKECERWDTSYKVLGGWAVLCTYVLLQCGILIMSTVSPQTKVQCPTSLTFPSQTPLASPDINIDLRLQLFLVSLPPPYWPVSCSVSITLLQTGKK